MESRAVESVRGWTSHSVMIDRQRGRAQTRAARRTLDGQLLRRAPIRDGKRRRGDTEINGIRSAENMTRHIQCGTAGFADRQRCREQRTYFCLAHIDRAAR